MEKRRVFLILLVVLAVLSGALFAVAFQPVRSARDDFRSGHTADAIVTANRWLRIRMWSHQYRQILAAAYLTTGARDAAQPHLDALRGQRLWVSVVKKADVANRLFARGAYEDFLAYDAAVRDGESDDLVLYRAAANAAIGRVAEADAALKKIDRDDVDANKLATLERAIADRRTGSSPFVVDRNGQTIASYVFANHDVVAVNTDFAPLVEKEAGALTIEAAAAKAGVTSRIDTTLDAGMQKAALAALGNFRSSLVAIDPRTNEILVLASNRGDGPLANLAIEQQYEPGSVMKVLTALAAREHNVTLNFPYTCSGVLNIDGRTFIDWLSGGHGTMASFDEALARSCNIVFADYGVRLGRDNLQKFYAKAGFNTSADLGLFRAPLGHKVGDVFNNFETGRYAVGLDHTATTPLHLAMIAAMVANRGALTTPRLYTVRRSILGEVIQTAPQFPAKQVTDRAYFDDVIRAMTAVVTHPLGTGRRAAVDGVTLALKTGTAGVKERGYQAAIIAFAPVENPKIAFALVAEESGPAEFAAAKIAHDFLTAIRGRL